MIKTTLDTTIKELIDEATILVFQKDGEWFSKYDISKQVHELIRYLNIRSLIRDEIRKLKLVDGVDTFNGVPYTCYKKPEKQNKKRKSISINTEIVNAKQVPLTPLIKPNKSGRIIISKKDVEKIGLGPFDVFTIHKTPVYTNIEQRLGVGKLLCVDKSGYIALRKKWLPKSKNNKFQVLINSGTIRIIGQ